jgi:hypothetical protein
VRMIGSGRKEGQSRDGQLVNWCLGWREQEMCFTNHSHMRTDFKLSGDSIIQSHRDNARESLTSI